MEPKQIAGYSLAAIIVLSFIYLYFSFIPSARKLGDPNILWYNRGLYFMILWLIVLVFISTPIDNKNMENYQHKITWGLVVIFIAPLVIIGTTHERNLSGKQLFIVITMGVLGVLQGWIGFKPNNGDDEEN